MYRILLVLGLIGVLTGSVQATAMPAAAMPQVDPQANLGITLSAAASTIDAGTQQTYSATVTNTGPAQAVNVVTVFRLGSGADFVSIAPAAPCSHAQGVITCTATLLSVNQSLAFTLVAAIRPETRGTLITQASVSSSIADPNLSNNTRSVATTISTQVDLVLALRNQPTTPAVAGAPLVYQFDVRNVGHSTATGVQLTIHIPAAKFSGFLTATPGLACAAGSDAVTCALGAVSPLSGTVPISIAVQPKSTLTSADTLVNTADIGATEPESSASNNFTSFLLGVERISDLTLTLTSSADLVASGAPITYTLSATNLGPSQNTSVQISLTLPLDHLVDPVISGVECMQSAFNTATLLCSLGTLEAGSTLSITITGTLIGLDAAPITVTASISGDNPEPDPNAPDTATISTTVTPYRVLLPLLFN